MCRYRSARCCYYKQLSGERSQPSIIICTWGKKRGQKIAELGVGELWSIFWIYENRKCCIPGTLHIHRNDLSINLLLITVTVFLTWIAASLMWHVAQEIKDSALKHTQLKTEGKFWRELHIIHDDKQKVNSDRVGSGQIKSNQCP